MLQFEAVKKLEKAFPPEQFDALSNYFEGYNSMAATKADMRESELRIQLEIERSRSEAEKIKVELKTDIEKVRAELKTDIEKVRAELTEKMEANKHEILKWMMGTVVAQTALIVALIGVGIAFMSK